MEELLEQVRTLKFMANKFKEDWAMCNIYKNEIERFEKLIEIKKKELQISLSIQKFNLCF